MVAGVYVLLVALGLLVGQGTPLAVGVKVVALTAMLLVVVLSGLVTRAELAAAVARAGRPVRRSPR